ncbi:MAG TPA: aconitate hydratase [Myxococcota bacterium]|nr:aconitate hydratase [Myxococcota bacterium]
MASSSFCATYQILQRNLVHGSVRPGEEIGIRADQLMVQDGTGTMVFLHLCNLGPARLKGKTAICYVDHNTLGDGGPENADDHRFLETSCMASSVMFSRPGSGIGHQVHLERFAQPGRLLLGADSHVTTMGGIGMLAIGTGGLELAVALTGAPHYFICPAVTRVWLTDKLKPWCSAKDLALHIMRSLSNRRNVETSLEYDGPGVKTLSVPQRATVANMGAELGVTTSLFPADTITRAYLAAQCRPGGFKSLGAGARAEFADEIEIDLGQIVPMVALPHRPDKVVPVRQISGLPVDQVAIGSCTNGFFEDISKVALMLKGRRISSGLSLVVAPATRQVVRSLMKRGYLKMLLDAGARLAEPACGFCIGHGHAPASQSVSVRTNNRNYEGRCGTQDARVYLVGPETAAATALRGTLCDPRDLRRKVVRPAPLTKLPIDDSLIIKPQKNKKVAVVRGPNIVDPPVNKHLPASLNGVVTLKLGDHVSTDHILPAGRHLKYRSNIQEYAWRTFRGVDPKFVRRAKDNQQAGLANVIIAGSDYGEGSSREHAAMCPMVLGVRVVIARNFERIHVSNLINYGIVPLVFLDPRDYDRIQQGDDLELPWVAAELKRSSLVTVRSHDKDYELKVKHGLSRRRVAILLAGGLRNYVAG